MMADANVTNIVLQLAMICYRILFFLLQAAPKSKNVRGEGFCARKSVCVFARERMCVCLFEKKKEKKKKKNSLGYITPPILVLMVGKNKITQVPSNNNNTSSNTSNNNSNTSNNTSSNTSNNNTDNNTSSNTNKKNSRT